MWSVFSKHLAKDGDTTPSTEWKLCPLQQLCNSDQKITKYLNCTEVHSRINGSLFLFLKNTYLDLRPKMKYWVNCTPEEREIEERSLKEPGFTDTGLNASLLWTFLGNLILCKMRGNVIMFLWPFCNSRNSFGAQSNKQNCSQGKESHFPFRGTGC